MHAPTAVLFFIIFTTLGRESLVGNQEDLLVNHSDDRTIELIKVERIDSKIFVMLVNLNICN